VHCVQIGNFFIVDATAEEEACATASLGICINRKGEVCGMLKMGHGSLTPATLAEMLKVSYAMEWYNGITVY